MGGNTSSYASGILTGAATGATALGSTGWGSILGAIGGGLLGAWDTKNKVDAIDAANEPVSDPTTPYKITLPSGATVTMYAHGTHGEKKKTITQDSNLNTALMTAKLYTDQEAEKKKLANQTATSITPTSQNTSTYITPTTTQQNTDWTKFT